MLRYLWQHILIGVIVFGIRNWSEWNNNYIDKDIDQTDEIDNYINDIEMDNIVELNNAKTNNEYSTENFTIL